MIQFYFLSILFNLVSGYLLITDKAEDEESVENSMKFSINAGTLKLILGVLTALTGLLKLLSSVEGDVPVAGDLLPALTGMAAGVFLVFSYYRERSTLETDTIRHTGEIILKHKKWVGMVAVAAALLHFLFPRVLFL
ncbi:MAG: hypothetical protein LBQ55_02205 [Treponema sp.]|jgi:hypothetical protein|nr:hypothetical protein [Treponema sp.]